METLKCVIVVCVVCFLSTFCSYMYLSTGFDALHLLIGLGDRNDTELSSRTIEYSPKRPLFQHHQSAKTAKTKPPFYPLNGTGQTADIAADFDRSSIQRFCAVETNLEAVIPVYSAPGNFERRKAMRETVGKTCTKMRCKMFFIVGVSLKQDIYDKVKVEYANVKDILMVNKVDTYRDLNNKVVAMLEFLISFCAQPKYIIHIIDDFYPNIKLILNQLHQINRTKFILGRVFRNTGPLRGLGSKWYISNDEYPHPVYPPYLVGVVYAFLNKDTASLRQKVHDVDYCWVEDVWFTGHVRQGAGFEPIPLNPDFTNNRIESVQQMRNTWCSRAGSHNVGPSDFYAIYNKSVECR